jgi:hypothetical protein
MIEYSNFSFHSLYSHSARSLNLLCLEFPRLRTVFGFKKGFNLHVVSVAVRSKAWVC